jgi:hypothetical protein
VFARVVTMPTKVSWLYRGPSYPLSFAVLPWLTCCRLSCFMLRKSHDTSAPDTIYPPYDQSLGKGTVYEVLDFYADTGVQIGRLHTATNPRLFVEGKPLWAIRIIFLPLDNSHVKKVINSVGSVAEANEVGT